MNPRSGEGALRDVVGAQTGRYPREPWRVAASCSFGYPTVIASPSRLADGTPFPTWTWLTCPYLVERVADIESSGGTAQWAERAATDPELADALRALDGAVRSARLRESGGLDACAGVGVAGQQDPLGVKCLHAHVAYALAGLDDPIGRVVVAQTGAECGDERCRGIVPAALDMSTAEGGG